MTSPVALLLGLLRFLAGYKWIFDMVSGVIQTISDDLLYYMI